MTLLDRTARETLGAMSTTTAREAIESKPTPLFST